VTGAPADGDARAGSTLRARREDCGLSLEELAAKTRIPLVHLEALEEGRVADLPEGPYAEAYMRALAEALDLPLGTTPPPVRPVDTGMPLWAVRWLALCSVLLVFGTVAWQTWSARSDVPALSSEEAVVLTRPVDLQTRRSVHIKVDVDGAAKMDRKVVGGEALTFAGEDRVVVEVPAVDAVRIQFDGRAIVPQGRQDAPRRLVFINDVAGKR
jgi:transcriptional regulator with XRE-family HTH domain